ncbi:MAG: hydroxymethylpyrimidine/phosphomethylpyrimidine kinase [Pseudomonadales bacterium]|nr:hydroxymethylpyrimidine/phosphomethylpyrimidine kinase [Pseudomonadales bacterium]
MTLSIDQDPPVVMAFSDHDPSGASGVQADVETLFSIGCHCSSITTSITSQDTYEYRDSIAIDSDVVNNQARAILEDMMVAAFKVGLVNSVENVHAIYEVLADYPEKQVIFEPALSSLHSQFAVQIIESLRILILPLSHIVTLSLKETRLLCPQADNLEASIQEIMDAGTEHVLVSDIGKEPHHTVNRLYSETGETHEWRRERLPHNYLGTSSTLAASIAAHIAHGFDTVTAIDKAQTYTWNSLKNGRRMGMGQYIPNRMFWHTN